jgi:hypothetical protein
MIDILFLWDRIHLAMFVFQWRCFFFFNYISCCSFKTSCHSNLLMVVLLFHIHILLFVLFRISSLITIMSIIFVEINHNSRRSILSILLLILPWLLLLLLLFVVLIIWSWKYWTLFHSAWFSLWHFFWLGHLVFNGIRELTLNKAFSPVRFTLLGMT